MPHVNYSRGETRNFVYQREHAKFTHYTWCKGKSNSNKKWKRDGNRRYRAQVNTWLYNVQAYDEWWFKCPPVDDDARDVRDLW